MSPKELTYIEDALGHEKFLKTQCQEAITNLQDQELKTCVEQISQKHQQIFLKNAGLCVISHFYSWYGIQMHLAIRKDYLCLQIIRCIF